MRRQMISTINEAPLYGEEGTVGIEIEAAFGYTIQRVENKRYESHGLVLRNVFYDEVTGSSDGDACAYIHLDRLICEDNGGWGIKVHTETTNASTSFTHLERCIIDHNLGGGIRWTGQLGLIELCGLHGNGVIPTVRKSPDPKKPTPVGGASGILIKSVHAGMFGLHINCGEFKGNSDVQVMVEEEHQTYASHRERIHSR